MTREKLEASVYTLYQLSLRDGRWRLRRDHVPPTLDEAMLLLVDEVRALRLAVERKRRWWQR